LAPREPERAEVLAIEELQRQDAHAHEVRAVDPLEALGDRGSNPEQQRPLRRPVARRAGSILLARDHELRNALLAVAARDVEDEPFLAVREVDGVRPLALAREGVAEPNV